MKKDSDVQQLVLQTNSGTTTETVLVPTRDIWKNLDTGLNLGNNWSTSNFNDTGWASGKAKLGYGNGDETTTVNFAGNWLQTVILLLVPVRVSISYSPVYLNVKYQCFPY
ncbi:MAG: hypothetical protein HXX08_14360 [Chloroflexi bacterium]|uniref:Uncharacterized protein n=1 Tax=Candidatus Chlorohelix allophototropha TaxID=3003348 RepID=A0A8T7M4M0_9CHLR|nr:hypothetical protein [Chloroflexota bacterium]WJW70353.1 hypothetical protein OZ401_004926 [Chloroflexota bacterium L227-S17]